MNILTIHLTFVCLNTVKSLPLFWKSHLISLHICLYPLYILRKSVSERSQKMQPDILNLGRTKVSSCANYQLALAKIKESFQSSKSPTKDIKLLPPFVTTAPIHFCVLAEFCCHACCLSPAVERNELLDSFWHLLSTRGLLFHWECLQTWEVAEGLPVSNLEVYSVQTYILWESIERWRGSWHCGPSGFLLQLCCVSKVWGREREKEV